MSYRALVIEDNPGDARLIHEALTRCPDSPFELWHAGRLGEGLQRLRDGPCDLALLDLGLPDSQGLVTFTRFHQQAPQIPVIVLTGNDDIQQGLEAVQAGAQDYLSKGQLAGNLLARAARYAIERHRSEEERRKAKAEFEDLYQNAPCGYHSLDPEGLIVRINDTELKWLGYSREEVVGRKKFTDLITADEQGKFKAGFRVLNRQGWLKDQEGELIRKDGSAFPVLINATVVTDGDGRFVMSRTTVIDLTERRRIETSQERSRQNYRALSVRLAQAEETTRRRLTHELHDQVGQQLTALGLSLTTLHGQLQRHADDTDGQTLARMDDSLELVRQVTERVRDIMSELRPPVLDDYGLPAALRWFGERLTARASLPVAVRCDGAERRLPPDTELALFRVAQEALTNVAKHAQAGSATVLLSADGIRTNLIIADDGIGFAVPDAGTVAPGHWGMVNMEERIRAVGGQFRVESKPGVGTRVMVEVGGKP
jgi:two-component system sensor histidine kinase UhpB